MKANKEKNQKETTTRTDRLFSVPDAVILRKLNEIQWDMAYYIITPWWAIAIFLFRSDLVFKQNAILSGGMLFVTTLSLIFCYLKSVQNRKIAKKLIEKELARLEYEKARDYASKHEND